MTKYKLEEYTTASGKSPFADWLFKLKDKLAQAKIRAKLLRATQGNFGDWKDIKGVKGLFEMREHYGGGYRVFYTIVDRKIVLLLAGSTKKDQNKTIALAKEYLDDYKRRNKQ